MEQDMDAALLPGQEPAMVLATENFSFQGMEAHYPMVPVSES